MMTDDLDTWYEIKPPVITTPSNGATGLLTTVGLAIVVSSFVSFKPGLSLTTTDIEVRTAVKGSGTLVYSSSSTLTIPALTLALNTTYYIRVRQNSGIYFSMWSDDIQITTSLT